MRPALRTPSWRFARHTAQARVLFAIGQAPVLPNRHGLLLDVILREEARLARHHLLDGRRDDHVVNVVVRLPWLPLLRGDDLRDGAGGWSATPPPGSAAWDWVRGRESLGAPSTPCPCHRAPRRPGARPIWAPPSRVGGGACLCTGPGPGEVGAAPEDVRDQRVSRCGQAGLCAPLGLGCTRCVPGALLPRPLATTCPARDSARMRPQSRDPGAAVHTHSSALAPVTPTGGDRSSRRWGDMGTQRTQARA